MGLLSDLIPPQAKLIAAGVGAIALVSLLAAGAIVVDRHGYAAATAVLQPKLDRANAAIGVLQAANATDEAAIRALHDDAAANDALITEYQTQLANFNQQADDTASAIRKLQSNDQTVDAYLRAPIPDALRGVLMGSKAGVDPGAVNAGRGAATAH